MTTRATPCRRSNAMGATRRKEGGAAISVGKNAGFAWQSPFCRRELAAILAAMRRAGAMTDMAIELALTDDAAISRINEAHLACPGPTNILAFPPAAKQGGGAPGRGVLLLSLDTLEREAILYGQEPAEHALRLLAHGMAHLAGHDHGERMDAFANALFAAGSAALEGVDA